MGQDTVTQRDGGIFSRLNQRIVAAIDRRASRTRPRSIHVSESGLTLEYTNKSQRNLTWPDLRRVVATRRDIFAGDLLCVLIELNDGGVVEIPATVEGWDHFCASLDNLPRARPTVEWATQALAVPVGTPVEIWSR